MSDDDRKPNPLEDLRKGFGLLFRAAKTAAEKLPTKELEKVVLDGAREVGRAVETVGRTIEKQWKAHEGSASPPPAEPAKTDVKEPAKADETNAASDAPDKAAGPRVDAGSDEKRS